MNMSETEMQEIEAIKALVEFTWKQESIERISGEIRGYDGSVRWGLSFR